MYFPFMFLKCDRLTLVITSNPSFSLHPASSFLSAMTSVTWSPFHPFHYQSCSKSSLVVAPLITRSFFYASITSYWTVRIQEQWYNFSVHPFVLVEFEQVLWMPLKYTTTVSIIISFWTFVYHKKKIKAKIFFVCL